MVLSRHRRNRRFKEARESVCPFTCLNGGSCVVYRFKPVCHCQDGFTGINCAVSISTCTSYRLFRIGIIPIIVNQKTIQKRVISIIPTGGLGFYGILMPYVTIILFVLALTRKISHFK